MPSVYLIIHILHYGCFLNHHFHFGETYSDSAVKKEGKRKGKGIGKGHTTETQISCVRQCIMPECVSIMLMIFPSPVRGVMENPHFIKTLLLPSYYNNSKWEFSLKNQLLWQKAQNYLPFKGKPGFADSEGVIMPLEYWIRYPLNQIWPHKSEEQSKLIK